MTEYGLWNDETGTFEETGFSTVEAAAQRLTDYAWQIQDNPIDLTIAVVCAERSGTSGEEDQR